MSRVQEFIDYLKSHIGDAYVWGAQGQILSEMSQAEMGSFVARKETSTRNKERALSYIGTALKRPLYAFDCSGLIMYFLQNVKGWSKSDMSSGSLYSACEKLDRDQLKTGDLVFRHNGLKIYHVGVYIDHGEVIEAKGRDDGVVLRDLNASGEKYWNRYGRLPLLHVDEPKAIVLKKTSPLMRGEEIAYLQKALNMMGYDCGTADGICGTKTLDGLRAFVKAHKEV